jgi:hypothetical protein
MKTLLILAAASALSVGAHVRAGEEPMKLETTGGVLHGTLLLPESAERPPVVFIHPGSGPTDRDGNSAALGGSNDSLKQLAEGLAGRGVASLRIDKRGIAASAAAGGSEADLRFGNYVDDAAAWVQMLRESRRFGAIVMAGHSEGALIVTLAAAGARPDAVILIAGPGRPAGVVVRGQLEDKLPAPLFASADAIITRLEGGETVAEVPPPLAGLFRTSVQPYLISWFNLDPVAAVAAVECPVLIVQGQSDLQVKPDDATLLAAARPGVKLVLLDGVNHVLKPVSGDLAAQLPSYRSPEPRIDARVVDAVAGFALLPDGS